MYGGHRLGDNLFAERSCASSAQTGERVWHYQLVAPRSLGLRSAGGAHPRRYHGRRPADQGRRSGHQAGVRLRLRSHERPTGVADRGAAGPARQTRRASAHRPTQPFPTRPPPFDRQGVTVDDLIDFTPELRAEAPRAGEDSTASDRCSRRRRFEAPVRPDEAAPMQLPGSVGGADWQGAAFDPETGDALRARRSPGLSSPISSKAIRSGRTSTTSRACARIRPGRRDCRCSSRRTGRITAIDLNKGEIAWTAAERRRSAGPSAC